MAFSNLDGLIAAQQQTIRINKTASMTTVATIPFTPFAQAGNPGAGTLAGVSTTTGTVPTNATAGFPSIASFASGTGHLAGVEFTNSVACRIYLYDLLWKGGAYAFNASTSGNTPTSYSSRVPNTDYSGLEIWFEQVTAATGIQSVAVTYTNEAGTTGRSTGTISQGTAGIVGRMTRMPLQAGDRGVQGVTGVVGSVATVGTFNVLVMRPLGSWRVPVAGAGDVLDFTKTGLKRIYDDSALYMIIQADSTASGIPELLLDIRNG
jgi:hypothetical protein